jgi:hypothetical protein
MEFIVAGVWGLIVYIVADGLGAIMGGEEGEGGKVVAKTGFAGFMYLELLDASFSFDGVIGAFALTNSLPIIAIGLGVGAMFVRSFTLMLVVSRHARGLPLPRARRLLGDRRAGGDHVRVVGQADDLLHVQSAHCGSGG